MARNTGWRLALTVASAAAGYALAARPWLLTWGATAAEAAEPLPGDAIVPHPKMQATRAITINAAPSAVWPWLAQIGQDRGGLYSYDWLENAFGLDFHSADTIHPEWQDLQPGDRVRLTPKGRGGTDLAFEVAVVEPERALVLRTPGDPAAAMAAGMPHASWTFVLRAVNESTTRLIVRFRSEYAPTVASALANHYGLEPIHFLMERRMLLGIKERAERATTPAALPTLLDEVMPVSEFRGAVSVVVKASAERIWEALRAVTLADMPVALAMGQIRYLPGRIADVRPADAPYTEPFLDQVMRDGTTIVLAENPGREMVAGGAGTFHDLLDQHQVPLAGRAAWDAFDAPAYQKLAMSFRVAEEEDGLHTRLTLEHRTHALSAAARRDFGWYWLLIKPASAALSWLLLDAVRRRAERGASENVLPLGQLRQHQERRTIP